MKSLAALCAYSVSCASGSTIRIPQSAVRNSAALTIESIMRGSVARVMAGGTLGEGLGVARAPPQPVIAAIRERRTVMLRVDINGPRLRRGSRYCDINTATPMALRPAPLGCGRAADFI